MKLTWIGPARNRRAKKVNRHQPKFFRPMVEVLEHRLAPATLHWSGATSALWNVSTNWQENALPTSGDTLVFDATATGHTTAQNNNTTAGNAYTLQYSGGMAYSVTTSNAIAISGSAISDSATAAVSLVTPFTNNSVNGVIISVTGSGTLTLSGLISGTGALELSGTGTLIFSGTAKTYSGNTTIDSGTTLQLGAANVLPNNSDVIDNGTFDMAGNSDTINFLEGYSGTAKVTNSVVSTTAILTITTTVSPALGAEFEGVIQDGAGTIRLTITGSGSFEVLAGSNIYTGITTIGTGASLYIGDLDFGGTHNGTLGTGNVNDGGSLIFNNGNSGQANYNLTVNNVISNNVTAGTVAQDGTGILTFSGASANTYTGLTTVNAGELDLNKTAGVNAFGGALVIGDDDGTADHDVVKYLADSQLGAVAVTVTSSGKFDLNGHIDTIGALTLDSGDTSGADVTTGAGTLTLGGTVTLNAIGTSPGAVGASISGKLGLGAARIFTVNDGTAASDLTISAVISGAFALTKNGAGTLTLTGTNSYTTTTISAGTLQIGDGTPSGNNGTLGTSTITDNATLVFQNSNASASNYNITLSQIIAGTTAAANFDWNGGGILTISGASNNTYLGTTTLNAGEIDLNKTAAINAIAGPLVIGDDDGTADHDVVKYLADSQIAGVAVTVTSSGKFDLNGHIDTIGALTLDSGDTSGADVTTGAGTLTLGGTVTLNTKGTSPGAVGASISGKLGLGAARIFTVNDGTAASDLTISAVVSGAFALTKNGAGTLTLSGNNTYTGLTTVSVGTLQLGAAGDALTGDTPLGTTAAGTTVTSGATLDLNGFSLVTAEALTLNGTGISSGGALSNSSATAASYSGLITLGSASSIVANAGNINVTNAGTITGATFGLTLGGSGNGSLSSILGTTSGTLTKSGTGTWTVSGASTYTGLTTVSAGTLKLGAAGGATNTPLGTVASGTVVASGGALDLNGFSLGTAEALTLNGTGISSGGALTNNPSIVTAATYKGLITLGSTSSINAANGDIIISNAGTITGSGFGLTLDGTTSGSSVASIIGTGTGTLTKIGSGTWTLNAANTYTGLTTVNAGTLAYGVNNAIATGAVTVNGSTAILSLGTFSDTVGIVTLDNNGTITGTTGVLTSTGSFEMKSGTASAILGGTAIALNKTTGGTVTLSGLNTYTGPTTISGGILSVSNLVSGPGNSNIGASSNAAANLVLDGGTLQYTGAFVLTNRLFTLTANGGTIDDEGTSELWFGSAGTIAFTGSGPRTLTLTGANGSLGEFDPVLGDGTGGATSLTKTGAGTWVLGGVNTYTGVTTISGGVLKVSNLANGGSSSNIGASTNAASNLVLDGGTLQYTGVSTASTDRLFTLSVNGGTLDGSSSGTLTFSNAGAIAFMGSGARVLTLAGSTGDVFDPLLADASGGATSLSHIGTGNWTVGGANSYTGVTTINGGGLVVNSLANGGNNSNIGASTNAASNLVLDGGALLYIGSSVSTDRLFTLTANGGGIASDGVASILTFSNTGLIAFTGSGPRTLTLDSLLSLGGVFDPVLVDGSGGVTNLTVNQGPWVVAGSNTYTGVTTISSGGTLSASSLGNGGSNSNIGASTNAAGNLVLDGGFLKYTGASASIDRLFTLTANGGSGLIGSGSGPLTFSNTGSIAFSGTGVRTLNLTGSLGGGGVLDPILGDGNGGATYLNVTGSSSSWSLNGLNTYTGVTTISGGQLSISTLANGGSNSNIGASSNAAANLVLDGGTLQYTANNFTVVSIDRLFTLTNNGGTIYCSANGALNFTNTGSIALTGTGARTLTLLAASFFDDILQPVLGDGSGGATSLTVAAGSWDTVSANTYTGITTLSGGSLFAPLANGGSPSGIGASSNAPSNLVLDNGTLTDSGGSTTDRLFTVTANGGTIEENRGTTFSNPGAVVFTGTGPRSFSLLSVGNAIGGSIDNFFPVIGDGSGGATSVIFGVRDASNPNTLVLHSNNTYSGTTTLGGAGSFSGGTLQLAVTNALPTTTAASFPTGGNNVSTFDLNGFSQTIASLTDLSSGNKVTLGSGTLTINGSTSTTFNGVISGTGSLIKAGSGTLTLAGANSYSGTTTISGGTLQVGATNALSPNSNVSDNATLDLNGHSAIMGALSGSGTVTSNSDSSATPTLTIGNTGTSSSFSGIIRDNNGVGSTRDTVSVTITGNDTQQWYGSSTWSYSGLTTIGSGSTLELGAGGITSFPGSGPVTDNGQLKFFQPNDIGVNNVISGTGSLLTTYNGTLRLYGANTYSGGTFLEDFGGNDPTLVLGVANALPSTGDVFLDAGTINLNGFSDTIGALNGSATLTSNGAGTATLTVGNTGRSGTFSGVIKNGNSTDIVALTKTGAGTETLSGTNTYTGATTINGGNLQVKGSITSTVAVNNTAMLVGAGTITGDVNVNAGGFLLPGGFISAAGSTTLTVVGNVTFDPSSELFVIANSKTNFSQLVVSGAHTVTLGSATVGVSQNYIPSGTSADNLTIISAPASTLVGTFNTTFPHNVSSGFQFGKGFLYGPGATVVMRDPPPSDGTPAAVTPTSPATVFLPTLPQQQSPDFIEALLTAVGVGPRSLPVTLVETIAPTFERAAIFASGERGLVSTLTNAGAWMLRSDHVGGSLDDSESADGDLPPTAAEIDAVFSRSAQELFQ
jgi:autotransporter-associated beta strand protein